MRITDVRTTCLAVPLSRVFRGGTYEITARCTIVTEVLTDAGINGCTYAGDERTRQRDIVRIIAARLKPLLIGQDPLDVERLWDAMFQETIPHGDRATLLEAIAAVDIALWDVKGKAAGLSVYKLLGGYHDRLPAMVIGGYYEDDKGLDGLIAEMVGYRQQGFSGVKMKVGRIDVREDAERVHQVRQAVGERFMIACDANQAGLPSRPYTSAASSNRIRSVGWRSPAIGMTTLAACGACASAPVSRSPPARARSPNTVVKRWCGGAPSIF